MSEKVAEEPTAEAKNEERRAKKVAAAKADDESES